MSNRLALGQMLLAVTLAIASAATIATGPAGNAFYVPPKPLPRASDCAAHATGTLDR